jgi:hypothetical protein
VLAWAASRIAFELIGAYSFRLAGQPVHWIGMLLQWDANFYLSIAEHGYVLPRVVTGDENGQSNLNFFPLLPLGSFLVGKIIHPTLLAGVAFTNACLILAALMLHRLASVTSREAADWTVLSLMLVPGSFAFSSMMTEAPFLAFSATAAYFAYYRRTGLAAASTSLLTITRLTGAAQALGFALDWLIDRCRRRPASYQQLFMICLAPLPLFIYFFVMLHLTGDALVAVHSNFAFWNQHIGLPFQNFFMLAWVSQPRLQIQCVIGLALVLVLLLQARQFTVGEWLFLILSLETISSADSLSPSLIRYVVGLYPVHLAMGRLCAERRSGRLLLMTLALVNGALALEWMHGRDTYI